MVTRRPSAIVLALSLVVALLASCAGSKQPAKEVTLEFWHGFNAHEVESLAQMIDKYWTPAHPNIKIHSKGETGPDAILTAISGGTAPDVCILWDPYSVTLWAQQGAIMDLTPYIEKSKLDMEQFVPASLAWAMYRGRYYALPFVDYNYGFYWNKALFREAGLDPDKPPADIAQLAEYARKLTKKDEAGKIVQLGWLCSGTDQFIELALAFGGQFYDPQTNKITANDPKVVEALTWQVDLAKEYGLTQVASFESGFSGAQGSPFFLGKAAMTIDGDWQVEFIKHYAPTLEYGVAPVPPFAPAYANSNNVMTNPIIVPRNTKHPQEAWEFAVWLATDPNVSKDFAKLVANLPQLKSVLSDYTTDPNMQMFVDLSNSPNARAWAPLAVTSLYYNELNTALSAVMTGQAEPQAALDAVTQKVQAELDKQK